MKELYEEITEVKFYHNPFKGYADNYILGSEKFLLIRQNTKKKRLFVILLKNYGIVQMKDVSVVLIQEKTYSDGAILL